MEKKDVDFSKIPDEPGIYTFRKGDEPLYIGRATSLRSRVRSYFSEDIAEKRSELIAKVIRESTRVTVEETDSVLDAIVLEAKRIREFLPPGNIIWTDNKSFNYLVVTDEPYPRFMVVRERVLQAEFPASKIKHLFGPFPNGMALKEALKLIRRIFPFFDTPFSVSLPAQAGGKLTPHQEKTVRFNQSIGLYPAFDEEAYKKTVRFIVLLFQAKKKTLLKDLEREMKRAAKEERFEDAAELKGQLFALTHIQDVTLIKEDLKKPMTTEFRVEAYDTAHIRGSEPRGVMTVVVDGEAVPQEYRTFIIRSWKQGSLKGSGTSKGDDYAALKEVIERRARHPEWAYPQLVVIDGGRGHLNVAKKALLEAGIRADVVSVVKDERHRPREILGHATLASTHEPSILLANAEAHRFAIGRHRRAMRRR